jgi:hypothetical protein
MNKKKISQLAIRLTIIGFVVPNIVCIVCASPITLQLTIDEKLNGLAVLSGNLIETDFGNGTWIGEAIGTNWSVLAGLSRSGLAPYSYDLTVIAQHLIAPHPGEAAPGLQLNTSQFYIDGGIPSFGPQDAFCKYIHPGSENHYDILHSHIDDLNGAEPGFISSNYQISARFTLSHTPEPTSLLLLSTGLGILWLGVNRRRRK